MPALRDGALVSPSALWWIPLLGTLLVFSAVGPRPVLDDFVLALRARGDSALQGLPPPRWDLFTFTTGDPAANRQLIERGVLLPWWSDERLEVAFYRPLSSLTHRLDYALWPNSPRLMYVHSLVWLALTLHLVARCYRRFESSPAVAGWCALLYAIDDARGAVVSWLSNRNSLIATSFGLLALLAHDSWRRNGERRSAWLGPAWLVLALLAGEFGVATLAYLGAYALFMDRGPARARIRALLPYGGGFAAWLGLYFWSGATVSGSGTYLSPFRDPGPFLSALPERAAVLLGATFGPLSADLSLFGPPAHALPRLAAAILVVGLALAALAPELRRDRIAQFWATGMLLAVVPVAASPPGDRLLPFVSFGGCALVARIVRPLFSQELRRESSKARRLVAAGFGLVHVALAPLVLPLRAAQMQLLGRALETGASFLDGVPSLAQRTVVIVNAPIDLFASYVQAERAWSLAPLAKRFYWLTSSATPVLVRRVDEKTLVVERTGGYFSTPLEAHYRRRVNGLGPGSRVLLPQMSAEVATVTADGRPLAVRFHFDQELESSSYLFLFWQGDRYRPLDLRGLAAPLQLPAEDLGQILARTALGGWT